MFFEKGQGFVEPPQIVEDGRPVVVADLQAILVAEGEADPFLFLEKAKASSGRPRDWRMSARLP